MRCPHGQTLISEVFDIFNETTGTIKDSERRPCEPLNESGNRMQLKSLVMFNILVRFAGDL